MVIKNPSTIKNIGDPYVLKVGERYYLYATSDFNGFYCWHSTDLSTWSTAKICYLPTEKSFGNACFWAPEVYEFAGNYYMYYTAQWKVFEEEQLRIGVAVSDKPEGPFEDVLVEQPLFDFGYGVLDAHILKDDGRNYLYYSRAGANNLIAGIKQSTISVIELGEDKISVVGEPRLLLVPEQSWEKAQKNQYWNEGPFVLKHKNKYHLMYSANSFESEAYGIGAAVADSPMGPFKKYEHNPILKADDQVSGPGHNSVVQGKDGQLYCVFHAHTDIAKKGGDRQVYITPLHSQNNRIEVEMPQINRFAKAES